MNDTATTVKLRWEVRTVTVYEAEVPVDQIPESLLWEDGDSWGIEEGDVDSASGADFLEGLDIAGSAIEQSLQVEGYTILDDVETIPPIMVVAAPVAAVDVSVLLDDEPMADPEDHAEWLRELREQGI